MATYFAYTRVSTPRQGTQSVSLAEQTAAIESFARVHDIEISTWFTETESAARSGRKVWKDLLARLTAREAEGLILHKIDRGARNLRDWSDLGELIDAGISVRFAHDDLRLDSRGGRLAADIQAVIAADYVRNLREEVLKGMEGRLRQGLYPMPAPIGYLNRGGGRVKVHDPLYATTVRDLFQLYATGAYSLKDLANHLKQAGTVSRRARHFTPAKVAKILHNPFYAGIIRMRGVEYTGLHVPLISGDLFQAVQHMLTTRGGSARGGPRKHAFAYSHFIRCSCGCHMTGETQKGYVYYRCHRCGGASLREDRVSRYLATALGLSGEQMPLVSEVHLAAKFCFLRDGQLYIEPQENLAQIKSSTSLWGEGSSKA